MPSSDKHKLTFVHIPKNAGTSAVDYLGMENLGHFHWTHYQDSEYKKIAIVRNPWDRFVSCYEYAKMEKSFYHSADGNAKEGKHHDYDRLKDSSFEQCVTLAKGSYLGFFRNPFKNGITIQETFPQPLRHQGWLPQSYWIYKGNELMVDKVIKQEEISDPEKGLPSVIKTDAPIPVTNLSTRNRDYKEYYNEETKKAVGDIYEVDIKNFGYEF